MLSESPAEISFRSLKLHYFSTNMLRFRMRELAFLSSRMKNRNRIQIYFSCESEFAFVNH